MVSTLTYKSEKLIARRARILEVVREEIVFNGFEHASMATIAERAGVAKKTLYNIYGGRDELLLAAVEEIVSEYLTVSSEVAKGVAAIVEGRRTAVATVAENPTYAIAMLQSVVRVPEEHRLVEVLLKNAVNFTVEHLEFEARSGGLVSTDIERVAHSVVGQGFGLVLLMAKGLIKPEDLPETSLGGLLAILANVTRGDLAQWVQDQSKTPLGH